VKRRPASTLALLFVLASGCAGGPAATPTASPTPTPPSASPTALPSASQSASPTPISLPSATPTATLAIGLPSPGCVNGWQSLTADSELGALGLARVAAYMGLSEPLEPVEIRYFVGPDPAWIIEPRFEEVQRWYLKASLPSDPGYRGRWLYELREPGREGVSAVAPYDSTGFESPDWIGFVGEGQPRAVDGLPGVWSGIDYDFVTGEGDSGQPGLPPEVAGCLAGT
jgi:hypothetical protein